MRRKGLQSAIRAATVIALFASLTACGNAPSSPSTVHKGTAPGAGTPAPDSTGNGGHSQGGSAPAAASLPGQSSEWALFGNNAWNDREALADKLTPNSAAKLSLVYSQALGDAAGSNETYPLEANGTLYLTTPNAAVYAINATTGELLWSYTPHVHLLQGIPQINRGVALDQGHLYVLTADDHLIALDAQTGNVLFDVVVADESAGYFESMAPLAIDGLVFVGSSGGDEGVRGFLSAYSETAGALNWQFFTVPKRGEGWLAATGDHGGGAVWTTPAYDPASHTVFFGTGNPSPDYFGESRPGPNPYTDSVVSLNAQTGTMNWAGQEVAHDLWDYDVASPPVLFLRNGSLTVGEAGKDGEWYEWDAKTGKQVITPVAFVKEDHQPPTADGVKEWPGANGGANYGPSAYDPKTGDVYVAGINGPEVLYAKRQAHQGYQLDFGTGQQPAPASDWTGTITAINVTTGKMDWQIQTDTPPIGGVSVSTGGVVLFGQANGQLTAVSATDGHTAWQTQVGAPIGMAPIIYSAGSSTYVTVVTGGAGSLANLFPYSGPSRVMTYRLP